jgi:hypothetical protein
MTSKKGKRNIFEGFHSKKPINLASLVVHLSLNSNSQNYRFFALKIYIQNVTNETIKNEN